jgi:choline monooxygenase
MNVEVFIPAGPTRTLVRYHYFFAPDADPAEVTESMRVSARLMAEDKAICEAVQRNLEAGVYRDGWLSPRHENGVAYFQRLVREAVGGCIRTV